MKWTWKLYTTFSIHIEYYICVCVCVCVFTELNIIQPGEEENPAICNKVEGP